MYVFCADFVWVSYCYKYGFRADFVWIPYRCMYEFRADFVWKSYSNLVWKVVAKSHTFPINFPHLQLVHFPYESRTPLFTGMVKPCALLGGLGGMFPRENFLKWCNLVRFGVYFDQILSLKN